MKNREPFAPNEWYHCYARGVEGRKTFENTKDYERFLQLLYITNSTDSRHRSDLISPTLASVVQINRTDTLVNVGAYCLMPNHFHLLLQEKSGKGIAKFMQKIGIAYTMYFNIRHDRTGNLFVKPFRSRHIADDRYFQRVLQYIHCNPAELTEPGWKSGEVMNMGKLNSYLLNYPYSSFGAHSGKDPIGRKILDDTIFDIENQSSPAAMINEAMIYYKDSNVKMSS